MRAGKGQKKRKQKAGHNNAGSGRDVRVECQQGPFREPLRPFTTNKRTEGDAWPSVLLTRLDIKRRRTYDPSNFQGWLSTYIPIDEYSFDGPAA